MQTVNSIFMPFARKKIKALMSHFYWFYLQINIMTLLNKTKLKKILLRLNKVCLGIIIKPQGVP
jgi:hypothetical protein